MKSLRVSIVFLNHNRIDETRITVEKLLSLQSELDNIEIIAVDNGSTDGTSEFLAGLQDRITVIRLEGNSGIDGYNKGFEIAQGEIIIVLDDDSHVEAETVRRVRAVFLKNPDIAIVAFRIVDKEGRRFNTWHIPKDDHYQESFAFVGCGFAIRRDIFREVGFYPPDFFLYHNEIYVSLRVRARGYKIVYDPLCVAFHRTSGQPRDPSRRIYYTLKNSLTLIWMTYPFMTAMYLAVSRIIISFGLALGYGKTGIAYQALQDFISGKAEKEPLSESARAMMRPFFLQNSIFHRIIQAPVIIANRREIEDMAAKDLVTIVVRTKNRPELLRKALQSIAAQTYRPVEVVLINDGGCSVDDEQLRLVLGDVSLTYLELDEGKGRAGAANVGLANAKGTYIGFLDDDDEFYPNHLSVLVPFLKRTGYRVAYSAVEFTQKAWDSEGRILRSEIKWNFAQDFAPDDLIIANYIPLIALVFESGLLKGLRFDESFELYEDWDMLIRAAVMTPFHFVNTVTAVYNQWGNSQITFQTPPEMVQEATLKIYKKHQLKIPSEAVYRMREENLEKDRTIAELNARIRELNLKIDHMTGREYEQDV